MLTTVALVRELLGIALILVGAWVWWRTSTRDHVAVDAVVVQYANWTRPGHVTFDYPLPDGTCGRARRMVGILSPVLKGRSGPMVSAGDRLTVYVDPRRPAEVKLARISSAGASAGGMLVLFGFLLWRFF